MSEGRELMHLEKRGALQLLAYLLNGDRYITEIVSRTAEDSGLVSQPTLEKTRAVLIRLTLVEEYEKLFELTGKTRLYLRLTPKGRRIAEHVKAIAEILAE